MPRSSRRSTTATYLPIWMATGQVPGSGAPVWCEKFAARGYQVVRFDNRVVGVVMTGMGDDGKEGSAWVKAQGGRVITEDEKSCVIYGMPRSVVEAGLSDAAISLPEIRPR